MTSAKTEINHAKFIVLNIECVLDSTVILDSIVLWVYTTWLALSKREMFQSQHKQCCIYAIIFVRINTYLQINAQKSKVNNYTSKTITQINYF